MRHKKGQHRFFSTPENLIFLHSAFNIPKEIFAMDFLRDCLFIYFCLVRSKCGNYRTYSALTASTYITVPEAGKNAFYLINKSGDGLTGGIYRPDWQHNSLQDERQIIYQICTQEI